MKEHLSALIPALSVVVACAAGAEPDGSTSTTGGSVPWTTSSGGGPSGGSAAGGGGAGPNGGAPQGGASSGGAPSTGGSATGGGGESAGGSSTGGSSTGGGGSGAGGAPPDEGQIVFVAMGPSAALAGHYEPAAGWSSAALSGASSSDRPAVALRAKNDGLAMFRNSGALAFSRFDGSTWTAAADVQSGVTTRAAPAVAAGSTSYFVTFHGDDFKHYFALYANSFNPTADPIGNPQSFGPAPAGITADGTDAVIAFTGNDGDVYDQRRSGTWAAAHGHGATSVVGTPSIVKLDQGADLLLVFAKSDTTVSFTTSTSGTWSTPATVPSTLTQDPIALAPLSGGKAVVAFRGTNSKVYTTVFDGSSWSTPVALASGSAETPSSPAVAPGIGGADAELVYVATGAGSAMHARLTGTTWSTPLTIGGSNLTTISVASSP